MTSPPSDPRIAPGSPDIVWFTGDDAVRFLNDLISREIADMTPGEVRRSFLLGPQGKLEFLLWVLRDEGRIGLVTDSGRGDDLAAYLQRYRIRVDVDIHPEELPVWVVVGGGEGWDVSWDGVPRSLVIGDRPDLETLDRGDYDALRIAAGEPAWDLDVDATTIPHESGLVPLSVDFDKGCFLGQELVARIDSRGGNVPRRLVRLEGHGELETGSPLENMEGRPVGAVTTAVGSQGLGVVHRDVSGGESVKAGGTEAVVRDLPVKTRA